MIVAIIGLVFFIGFETLLIIMLYADRMIYMYEKGDDFMLDSKVYDVLKWVAIVALPALSTFIVVIGKIWGWGDISVMVAQTITAVATLLGALLGISTIQYNKEQDNG